MVAIKSRNGGHMEKAGRSILISGVNGFVGSHLAEECIRRGWKVSGMVRNHRSPLENIESFKDSIDLRYCDITDPANVRAVISDIKPDYLFSLAAQSFVPASWESPHHTLDTNIKGTLNILEAVRKCSPHTTVQVASTSEVYGLVHPNECPINENNPLRPLSPYGVSKAACDMLARQYCRSYNMRVIVTRGFNHEGAKRGKCFAPSWWAYQCAAAEAGLQPPIIKHGNLSSVRDISHVLDIVDGYILACEKGRAGEVYCLGSGEGHSMDDVLSMICEQSTVKMQRQMDTSLMRPSDVPLLVCDSTKAQRELNWKPTRGLDIVVRDLINWWRQRTQLAARPAESVKNE